MLHGYGSVVVEELDPIIETHVKAMGIRVEGKDRVPMLGELNPRIVRQALTGEAPPLREPANVPNRPPNLCAGCPNRILFFALNKCKVTVTGDIGCYTLSALPPLKSMDTCVCMGASIGNAFGIEKALGPTARGKVVAVIGAIRPSSTQASRGSSTSCTTVASPPSSSWTTGQRL